MDIELSTDSLLENIMKTQPYTKGRQKIIFFLLRQSLGCFVNEAIYIKCCIGQYLKISTSILFYF